RLDSTLANQAKYVIQNFTGTQYYYSNTPTTYYKSYKQKQVSYTSITNEIKATLGNYDQTMLLRNENSKFYCLYTSTELQSLNLKAGKIQALSFESIQPGGDLPFLKIRMKNTKITNIDSKGFNIDDFKEVYFQNYSINSVGPQNFPFNTPFDWDGTSNILVEISYNQSTSSKEASIAFSNFNITSVRSIKSSYSLVQNGGEGFKIDNEKIKTISDEITISFWSFGNQDILPINNSVFEGVDILNNRQVNVHLPWSNGSIYWDCGNDGTGYDRIEKAANPNEYEGQWVYWTFTKNAKTGIMNIYKNGSLWLSGSGKKRLISLNKFNLFSSIDDQLSYFGRINNFCIWNKELDSVQIKAWIFQPGNSSHPSYSSLIYYLPLNHKEQGQITDLAPNPKPIPYTQTINWNNEKGRNIIGDFENIKGRPVTTFIQGNPVGLNIQEINALEEIENPIVTVNEYEIRTGKAVIKNKYSVFPAGQFITRNENNDSVGVKTVPNDGVFTFENITYQSFSPAKFELVSLVTPYGINLDLSKLGKTFVFDVTDYAPILKGNKRLSLELGGENQEEIDIKFQYIKGKPAREVKEIQNVYTFQRGYFGNILRNEVFEPRNLILLPTAQSYKLRTTITGHDQNGEFTDRSHFIKVDGNKLTKKFDFNVWKECGDNPIYPQGGTWIFDRAGWCPGAPSDVHYFDITNLADPGSTVKIDYGLNGANMDAANYLVSCQIVSYGAPNYVLDAGLESIIRPNSERVEFERFNPSCSRPSVMIKNFGTTNINNVKFSYQVVNGPKLEYIYTGLIKPFEIRQIDLPIDNMSFWTNSNQSVFLIELISVNGQTDENPRNNKLLSNFKLVKSFDYDPIFEIRTNTVDGDNSYRILDMNSNVVIENLNIPANTTIQENLKLPNGCYTIEVTDVAQDGLSFWFFPSLGSGSSSLKKKVGNSTISTQIFKPDFGAGFQYDLIINKPNKTVDFDKSYLLSIYPNPAQESVNIDFQSKDLNHVQIKVLNSSG
ncbi:MAG: peptide-N-glycosidase F-related protein, partial [Saprospiraceae bacterium]